MRYFQQILTLPILCVMVIINQTCQCLRKVRYRWKNLTKAITILLYLVKIPCWQVMSLKTTRDRYQTHQPSSLVVVEKEKLSDLHLTRILEPFGMGQSGSFSTVYFLAPSSGPDKLKFKLSDTNRTTLSPFTRLYPKE